MNLQRQIWKAYKPHFASRLFRAYIFLSNLKFEGQIKYYYLVLFFFSITI